jgi:hypothetical protein
MYIGAKDPLTIYINLKYHITTYLGGSGMGDPNMSIYHISPLRFT